MENLPLHKFMSIITVMENVFADAEYNALVHADRFSEKGWRKASNMPSLNLDHIKVYLRLALWDDIEELEQKYVTEAMGFKQTTMHRVLKALEAVDLVIANERSARDPRSFIVRLSPKGKKIAHMLKVLVEMPAEKLDGVNELNAQYNIVRAKVSDEIGFKTAVKSVEVEPQAIKTGSPKVDKATLATGRAGKTAREELKTHLERRFDRSFQVGTNYIKSTLEDDSILRTISFSVLFKRLDVRNVVSLSERLMAMSDDEVRSALRPNLKYRDVSTNPLEELQQMTMRYGPAAIEENPSLQRRFAQLSAQVAREARMKERLSQGIGSLYPKDASRQSLMNQVERRKSLMNRKPGTDRDN